MLVSAASRRRTPCPKEKNDERNSQNNAADDDERSGIGRRDPEVREKRRDDTGEPHPAGPSGGRADNNRRRDKEAEREHRLTMGDAVGGEGVNGHRTRYQCDEREDAEKRLAILQQRGLAGIEIRLDRANRRYRGRGVYLADLGSDRVAERERIARCTNDERHDRAPTFERGALLGRLL